MINKKYKFQSTYTVSCHSTDGYVSSSDLLHLDVLMRNIHKKIRKNSCKDLHLFACSYLICELLNNQK